MANDIHTNDFISHLISTNVIKHDFEETQAREFFTLASNFSNLVNSGFNEKSFATAFIRAIGHRTLEQKMMLIFFMIMEHYCDNQGPGDVDDRNKASRSACKLMIDAFQEKYGYRPSQGMPRI